MKNITDFLNEGKIPSPSKDSIKNDIYNHLTKYFKINYKVNSLDDAMEDVTKDPYTIDYLTKDDIKDADHIYVMKCWNGGENLIKNYAYNLADVVSHRNNTDVQWFFVVEKKKVKVFKYSRRYYGMDSIKEQIYEFEI